MSREENKDIVRRFHDGMLEFFRTGNLDFLGHTATGKRITLTETHIDQVANGKIVRHDGDWDQMGMMQQLALTPNGLVAQP